jgi:hypothetical protein
LADLQDDNLAAWTLELNNGHGAAPSQFRQGQTGIRGEPLLSELKSIGFRRYLNVPLAGVITIRLTAFPPSGTARDKNDGRIIDALKSSAMPF